ncbi:MAG: folate-binding protein [Tabrizicola sp.]|uniref:CAF17-like 4Fe-4S cluster assembly/insertion protein YgfZ n=1 Tax=Tabrizicola sp. TaxID=2005166 RepID=UPI002ABC3515|nr:folate-binding protein [Tabrizicola sp.]MDZ4085694.1 folate-binding protein [Tabrizicola sp.]
MTHTERTLWTLTGTDALTFLQGLVSNDLRPLETGPGIVWAALLSPQGKYLADFFVVHLPDGPILIDIATPLAADTLRRLTLYRLRADVQIQPASLTVSRGLGPAPERALPDPRHPALGWRLYGTDAAPEAPVDWDAIRVQHVIPESGIELVPDDTYILEAGFERLQGVDFRKGCYVGQEVTARMKHKTELRKGLVRVAVEGTAPVGTEILADGKSAGTLFTQSNGKAIAYLRFDRAGQVLQAGSARVQLDD